MIKNNNIEESGYKRLGPQLGFLHNNSFSFEKIYLKGSIINYLLVIKNGQRDVCAGIGKKNNRE